MKDRLAKLVDVKSIITILITASFVYGFITNVINAEQFMTIFGIIIAFYFGTQSIKKGDDNGNKNTHLQ